MARNKTKASLEPHSRIVLLRVCTERRKDFYPSSSSFFLFFHLMAEAIKKRQREKWEEEEEEEVKEISGWKKMLPGESH